MNLGPSYRIRRPVVAGTFYEASKEALKDQITRCFTHPLGAGSPPEASLSGPRDIIALVCPHAGYMYSGPVASHAYASLAKDGRPETFVLLGPNHHGIGSGVSIMTRGIWRTPLGDAAIDAQLADKILGACDIIDSDEEGHRLEHSLEVQIPFLQYIYGTIKIVPISFMLQDLATARDVGKALADTLRDKNAIIIASTDLTHYESQKSAQKKDGFIIEAIKALDEALLFEVVERYGITMCGPAPVAAAITASKSLGAKRANILSYRTSGDVTEDYSSVVGYLAAELRR
ncbi:MAG: AmmeMemoRadiSam system protein B [Candidatus Bathyarchaeia archaeon]